MTQPLDWSLCKPGATVKFRCGGVAIIKKCEILRRERCQLEFKEIDLWYDYYTDGFILENKEERLLDIIEILPPPEPVKVELYGAIFANGRSAFDNDITSLDTHRITFNLIDGQPDCTSITMEVL